MWQKRIQSFKYAFKGLFYLFSSQIHAKIHLLALAVVGIAGIVFDISKTEWLAVVLVCGAVLSAEALNTAIEAVVDLVSPDYHPLAGRAKDVAAGAVLILAFTALAVAGLIFVPKIKALCGF